MSGGKRIVYARSELDIIASESSNFGRKLFIGHKQIKVKNEVKLSYTNLCTPAQSIHYIDLYLGSHFSTTELTLNSTDCQTPVYRVHRKKSTNLKLLSISGSASMYE